MFQAKKREERNGGGYTYIICIVCVCTSMRFCECVMLCSSFSSKPHWIWFAFFLPINILTNVSWILISQNSSNSTSSRTSTAKPRMKEKHTRMEKIQTNVCVCSIASVCVCDFFCVWMLHSVTLIQQWFLTIECKSNPLDRCVPSTWHEPESTLFHFYCVSQSLLLESA